MFSFEANGHVFYFYQVIVHGEAAFVAATSPSEAIKAASTTGPFFNTVTPSSLTIQTVNEESDFPGKGSHDWEEAAKIFIAEEEVQGVALGLSAWDSED